jgi:hypothetical protein
MIASMIICRRSIIVTIMHQINQEGPCFPMMLHVLATLLRTLVCIRIMIQCVRAGNNTV